jgi:hypothetical protein
MRKKVSTLLEEWLIRSAKLLAVKEGKQVSEIYAEALERYLGERGAAAPGVVAESWGAIRADKATVRRILADEDWLLDS